jgi:hypothetical protein
MDVSQVERWLGCRGRVANGNKKHDRTVRRIKQMDMKMYVFVNIIVNLIHVSVT